MSRGSQSVRMAVFHRNYSVKVHAVVVVDEMVEMIAVVVVHHDWDTSMVVVLLCCCSPYSQVAVVV